MMEVDLGMEPFDIDFHPSNQLLATGLVNGELSTFRYGEDSTLERVLKVKPHAKHESCRTLRFFNHGNAIVTGSSDRSIVATDVETGVDVVRIEEAHRTAVNRIIILTESTIASGDDDDGCVKLWDTRQRSCTGSFRVHKRQISDMTFAADSMKLVATSAGDGTLSVCNLRSNKVSYHSEVSEEGPVSVVIMKNGQKIICGTLKGTLLLYSCDRCVDLAAESVDVLLEYDEDRVITGCDNGLISLVGILPNRIIQPIAEHSDDQIEGLAFSHDKKFLGSISHDQTLKLFDLDELLQASENSSNDNLVEGDSNRVMGWTLMIVNQNLPKGARPRAKTLPEAVPVVFLLIYSQVALEGEALYMKRLKSSWILQSQSSLCSHNFELLCSRTHHIYHHLVVIVSTITGFSHLVVGNPPQTFPESLLPIFDHHF